MCLNCKNNTTLLLKIKNKLNCLVSVALGNFSYLKGGCELAKRSNIKYFTEERKALINPKNLKLYETYYNSKTLKNPDSATWRVYKNYFIQFLVFLAEYYDNVGLYDKAFLDNAPEIVEDFMSFCVNTLENRKKIINTKVSAISSFFIWSVQKGKITNHPFQNKIERMQNAKEEKILNSYFLTEEQVKKIRTTLKEDERFDIQDQLLFEVAYDSANRLGALEFLNLKNLDLDNMLFSDIREKRGYRVEVVFGEYCAELVRQWLNMRTTELCYDRMKVPYLFIAYNLQTKTWGRMKRGAIAKRFRKYGLIVGIPDFRPHCMRKTRLNHVYETTGDLTLAAELGNHKSTETTREAYIKPKSKAEIRDRIHALTKQRAAELAALRSDVDELTEQLK